MDVPNNGWKIATHSFSKMVVWFKDGNVRTFHSYDWKSKYSKDRDAHLGLQRLKNLAMKYSSYANSIEIYDRCSGKVVFKFFEGRRVDVEHNIINTSRYDQGNSS